MSKYVYPAIFTSEPDGGYSVYFPDLEGCYTCGDTLADALFMAEDALALILYGYEKDQRPIPQPSKMSGIKVTADSFLSMVACDTLEYRKRFNNKAVKKTLTIPEWLNEAAVAMNIINTYFSYFQLFSFNEKFYHLSKTQKASGSKSTDLRL